MAPQPFSSSIYKEGIDSRLSLTSKDISDIFVTDRGKLLDFGWYHMREREQMSAKRRMIHVRIPEELHKKLRVSVAEADTTLQDWVAMAIRKELEHRDCKRDSAT